MFLCFLNYVKIVLLFWVLICSLYMCLDAYQFNQNHVNNHINLRIPNYFYDLQTSKLLSQIKW